jgi:hypothetical protein
MFVNYFNFFFPFLHQAFSILSTPPQLRVFAEGTATFLVRSLIKLILLFQFYELKFLLLVRLIKV